MKFTIERPKDEHSWGYARLKTDSEKLLAIASFLPHDSHGVVIDVLGAEVRGRGYGQKVVERLVQEFGEVYSGESSMVTISPDAEKMFYRMADDPKYQVTGTGVIPRDLTEWDSRRVVPEHVRITLSSPGQEPTHFRFRKSL